MCSRRRLGVTPLEDRVVPTPVITVAAIAGATEGGSSGTFRVSRSEGTSSLSLTFNVQGTAELYTDHGDAEAPYQIVFGLGQSYVDVTIGATNDSTSEPTETVILNIIDGASYDLGDPATATIHIFDNDTPVVSAAATDTAEASATGGFSLTRIGNLTSALTVNYAIDGTADPGDDYEELAGSVQFAANADRVEIPVVAFGDNTAEDPETMELTLSSGSGYTIDTGADEATVTIADQPLTVSVVWLADGTEGGGNATLRFTRAGDLTDELVVTYDVGGTATAGTDYTALSGSVTFDEDEDTVDVTVALTNDGGTEATESVTVTVDEDEDYLLGNDSDTLFIWDNDGSGTIWTNADQDCDWANPDNWSGLAVPTSSDHVYFIASTTQYPHASDDCPNLGEGETSIAFAGIHLVDDYPGWVVLAAPLTVGTYEQTTGILDQPDDAFDLTITDALSWTGGTLSDTDGGADVNIDGAVGRVDPPDTGSIGLGSTLRVMSGALATFLPGTLDLIGGSGIYISASDANYVGNNVNFVFTNPINIDAQVNITSDSKVRLLKRTPNAKENITFYVPIRNDAELTIDQGIHVIVLGQLGGANGPAISQEGGKLTWWTGSNIDAPNGMSVTGGEVWITTVEVNPTAIFVGPVTFGNQTSGGALRFAGPKYAQFRVQGDATWNRGSYVPRFDGAVAANAIGDADAWIATGKFTVKQNASLEPSSLNAGNAGSGAKWLLLAGWKGISSGGIPTLPGALDDFFIGELSSPNTPGAGWYLLRE